MSAPSSCWRIARNFRDPEIADQVGWPNPRGRARTRRALRQLPEMLTEAFGPAAAVDEVPVPTGEGRSDQAWTTTEYRAARTGGHRAGPHRPADGRRYAAAPRQFRAPGPLFLLPRTTRPLRRAAIIIGTPSRRPRLRSSASGRSRSVATSGGLGEAASPRNGTGARRVHGSRHARRGVGRHRAVGVQGAACVGRCDSSGGPDRRHRDRVPCSTASPVTS